VWGTSDRPHCSKGPLGNPGGSIERSQGQHRDPGEQHPTAAALFVALVRADVGDRHLITQAPRQVAEGDR
jgi:hypothetical protein